MALITEAQIRKVANDSSRSRMASTVLKEEIAKSAGMTSFDVFLSHSFKDAELIFGVKKTLEKQGLTVYVDWVEDPQLDRGKVTEATAAMLRRRMKQSKTLIYAHSNSSPDSKWMPWELGYFDGYRGVVAILPLAKADGDTFTGQEFLGLYPYLDGDTAIIWINKGKAARSRLGQLQENRDFRDVKGWMRELGGVR
ncbi:toll/interleukin-1 receptor domain-containing protein [Mesorhizobium sp. M00.F.Ca.ET.217.01.1.1]|uniref:toll/interleukin-1 receptor domain-containing protein n=1 Tax=Mesorhizobium sp. M00.F.Ca.ET.217.01.1.1 TaxID=2500529 RepID=UPI000FD7645C|nr:toll/interleukin-1 receptor domain-containing protein [Mesorhizobium sp. M00.F.Ca.ET.217.01.1.1]TGQ13580.1 TIR domain-containing protein [Mesorhizobium sp. M00.F.Ca.ET.217.01.1.1]TGV85444.1 TIR domain-containing protein [Mesorhizobium sp. M00.F.Ca.ET.158.01.1.1]